MTENTAEAAATSASARRTLVLLGGWLVAAMLAGIPAGEASTADAEARRGKVPVVVNTGPECFAGHAAPAGPSKARD